MRVLAIAPTPFFSDRGCHIRMYEQQRGVKKILGEDITSRICAYHLGDDVEGMDIVRSIPAPWYKKRSAGPSWHKLYLDFFLLLTSIKQIFVFRPDIIHAHLHEGMIIAWFAKLFSFSKALILFDVQGSLVQEVQGYRFGKHVLHRMLQRVEKWTYRKADKIICSSDRLKQFISEKYSVCSVEVVFDGASHFDINSRIVDSLEKNIRGKKIILYSGGLSAPKGFDLLLKAFAELLNADFDVYLVVIGYPNVDKYRKIAQDLGIEPHIAFLGRVSYFDLGAYMGIATIAVDPKPGNSKEASGKILNYMSAGIPVVCFENEHNRLLLGNQNGFAHEGISHFSEQMKKMLTDETRLLRASNENRNDSQKFSWNVSSKKLSNIYEVLVQ